MNSVSISTQTYLGKSIECAKFIIDTPAIWSLKSKIKIDSDYVFSFVGKANSNIQIQINLGGITKQIQLTTSFNRYKCIFQDIIVSSSPTTDVEILFPIGTFYIYNTQLEHGNIVTDWRAAGTEDALIYNIIYNYDSTNNTIDCNYTFNQIMNRFKNNYILHAAFQTDNPYSEGEKAIISTGYTIVESTSTGSAIVEYLATYITTINGYQIIYHYLDNTISMVTKNFANLSHTHTTANITGFENAVDARITRTKVLGVISTAASWTGSYAFVEGSGATASGDCSHAEGTSAVASSTAAHAEGYQTTASGKYAHAEGQATSAAGVWSHAEGWRTTAAGDGGHAEGVTCLSTDSWSHAEGQATTASAAFAHAEGNTSVASGKSSHAEGDHTTASGYCSHAEGSSTYASSDASHAEGSQTTASGRYSHAEGGSSWARGGYSHAEGRSSTAWSSYSHAEGDITVAYGQGSHAEGYNTTATGMNSHAEGSCTNAVNSYSHAGGYYTIADRDYQAAIGKYNATVSDALFIIGKGTATNARSNAMYVTTAGNINCVSVTQTSDRRLKDNITNISTTDLAIYDKLQPKSFTLKSDDVKSKHYGFIAQDVLQSFEELGLPSSYVGIVHQDQNEQGYYNINYTEFIALLVEKQKIMQQEIDELKAVVAALKQHQS